MCLMNLMAGQQHHGWEKGCLPVKCEKALQSVWVQTLLGLYTLKSLFPWTNECKCICFLAEEPAIQPLPTTSGGQAALMRGADFGD